MKVIDLFAGCGGLSLGFERSGFELVAAFDNWLPAIEVYRTNFNHPIFELDLASISDYQIFKKYSPDIIIVGPPCQDFSSSGKRDEGLGRANLTISFAKIVVSILPKFFVMENVERIKKSLALSRAIGIFKEYGYGLTSQILDASHCGVPQTRKRYFLIGELKGVDNNFVNYLTKNLSSNPMTIFDYLGWDLNLEYYYRHPRSYQRRGIFSIYEPSPTIRGVNRPIPKNYKRHSGDLCEPNENIRPLTTIERSYLQTFPKDFKFKGSKTDLEQMIANAVPVNLAKYVGKSIQEYLNDRKNDRKLLPKYQQLELFV